MVFNTTFDNISDISWWSVILVEETGVFRENVEYNPVILKLHAIYQQYLSFKFQYFLIFSVHWN